MDKVSENKKKMSVPRYKQFSKGIAMLYFAHVGYRIIIAMFKCLLALIFICSNTWKGFLIRDFYGAAYKGFVDSA